MFLFRFPKFPLQIQTAFVTIDLIDLIDFALILWSLPDSLKDCAQCHADPSNEGSRIIRSCTEGKALDGLVTACL